VSRAPAGNNFQIHATKSKAARNEIKAGCNEIQISRNEIQITIFQSIETFQ
jgi:hypothetical protein